MILRRNKYFLLFSIIILIISIISGALLSLSTGGLSGISLADFIASINNSKTIDTTVVTDIRLPRSLVAALLGINLGLAGLILQAITLNSLASPGILGINQGATLGIALSVVLPSWSKLSPDIMSIIGAFFAGILTFAIAGGFSGRINQVRMILGGIAVASFSYAMVRFTYTIDDDIAISIIRWTSGNITDVRWSSVYRLIIVAIIGITGCLLLSHRFNLIALGQFKAQGLGINTNIILLIGALLSAVLTGVSVTVAGPIAFAGLVIPHLSRLLFGSDYRLLTFFTVLIGASLLLWADAFSKIILTSTEVPIGIVVALIGAPWFLVQTLITKEL